jgi:hypothetical protein
MSSPHIASSPCPGATTDTSRAAVAHCYAYLIERRRLREETEGGPETAPKDDVKESNGYAVAQNHSK